MRKSDQCVSASLPLVSVSNSSIFCVFCAFLCGFLFLWFLDFVGWCGVYEYVYVCINLCVCMYMNICTYMVYINKQYACI